MNTSHNTVGSNGFPTVSAHYTTTDGDHTQAFDSRLNPRNKQALKMTQMPIFLAENPGPQRNKIKKKETPKRNK